MTEEQLVETYLASLTQASAANAVYVLRPLRRFLAARDVALLHASTTDLVDFRHYSLTTRKTKRQVDHVMWRVRRFYEWCRAQGYLDRNPATSFKITTLTRIPPPTQAELERLKDAAAASVVETRRYPIYHRAACRLQLIIDLASDAGVRPTELLNLTLADFDPATCSVHVGHGTADERTLPLSPDTWRHFLLYLEVTGRRHPGGPGYLFHQRTDINKPLTRVDIASSRLTKKLMRRAGLRGELTIAALGRNVAREIGEVADLDVARAASGRAKLEAVAVVPVSVSMADRRATLEQCHPLRGRTPADLRRLSVPK
ncbi:site-specific integrase [Microvirga sp. 17 mud 1-3]|uniref:tyrosine-type recombinase/integrase n=1 Tax=Microvirga sp. 17 mud 1-3 TaxID=2082949 RepID=UPI000D6BA209|nr:site-specific integrase [Microvirga sp. 17 mud 1-3]AWM87083.1 hypothetical protein C4E04_10280 [Microvirga sp. 17 mud 1-3]